eukprot:2030491-Amphidinium_carterae.1
MAPGSKSSIEPKSHYRHRKEYCLHFLLRMQASWLELYALARVNMHSAYFFAWASLYLVMGVLCLGGGGLASAKCD